jgi:hypothetical protein
VSVVWAVIAATVLQIGGHDLSLTPPDGWRASGAMEGAQWSGSITAPTGASMLLWAAPHDLSQGPVDLTKSLGLLLSLVATEYPNLLVQGTVGNEARNGFPGTTQAMSGEIKTRPVAGVAGVIDAGPITIMYLFAAPKDEVEKDLKLIGKSLGTVLVDKKKGPWAYPHPKK